MPERKAEELHVKTLTVEKLVVKDKWGTAEICGSEISLCDGRSVSRVRIALDHHGNPSLEMIDATWHRRILMNVNTTGGANISLEDGNENTAMLISTESRGPRISLHDVSGKIRLGLYLDDEGEPVVELTDRSGNDRFRVTMDEDGTPAIVTYGADGKETWAVPAEGQKVEARDGKEAKP